MFHFNPNVADVAALYCEKVRVNPGNYVDPARKFIKQEYTDEEYAHELQKIEVRFVPFLNICKEHHTAIRIGVNHGSLSDRIRNRYGDTPEGIVEELSRVSAHLQEGEFPRCGYQHQVIQYRCDGSLHAPPIEEMEKQGMNYPLHLGVTEAGEGEDGRIKSAVGIGALLADGIGDTVRVSLSEEPAAEIPVARISGRLHRQEEGASDDSCHSLSFIRLAAPYPPRNRGCRQYRRQQRSGGYQQPNQRREHRL